MRIKTRVNNIEEEIVFIKQILGRLEQRIDILQDEKDKEISSVYNALNNSVMPYILRKQMEEIDSLISDLFKEDENNKKVKNDKVAPIKEKTNKLKKEEATPIVKRKVGRPRKAV